MAITCSKKEREELLKAIWVGKEIRPCNEKGEKDGNWNYVHQEHIATVILRLIEVDENKEEAA